MHLNIYIEIILYYRSNLTWTESEWTCPNVDQEAIWHNVGTRASAKNGSTRRKEPGARQPSLLAPNGSEVQLCGCRCYRCTRKINHRKNGSEIQQWIAYDKPWRGSRAQGEKALEELACNTTAKRAQLWNKLVAPRKMALSKTNKQTRNNQ